MAINTSKVIVGGVAAGLVMIVIGFLVNGLLLGQRMMDEMYAVAPTLQGRGTGGAVIAARILTSFAVGLLLVWIYAAIRPRFGPGMKTATYAALVVWCFGFLFYLDWLYVGLMTGSTYAIVSVVQLVTMLIAAYVGARLYTEPSTASVT